MAITFDDTTIKHSLYTWKVPFQCTERACVIFFRFRNSLQKMYYVTKSVASFKDQREYILNVRKKVLGVIISVEVATHQPPILLLPVDSILADCCLSFTHHWIGMAPSYKEMPLEQWKRVLGLLLSQLKGGVLPWGSLTIVADEIGVACSTISRLWQQVHGARKESLIITPEIAS